MDKNQSEKENLEKLAAQAKECHHLSEKKAQTFAAQAQALQKNLLLRKKQKQDRLNRKNQSI